MPHLPAETHKRDLIKLMHKTWANNCCLGKTLTSQTQWLEVLTSTVAWAGCPCYMAFDPFCTKTSPHYIPQTHMPSRQAQSDIAVLSPYPVCLCAARGITQLPPLMSFNADSICLSSIERGANLGRSCRLSSCEGLHPQQPGSRRLL